MTLLVSLSEALAFLEGPIAGSELARAVDRRRSIAAGLHDGALTGPEGPHAIDCLEVSATPIQAMTQTQLTQPGCDSTAPGCANYSGNPDCMEETGELCNSDEPNCKFDKTDPPQCPGPGTLNCPTIADDCATRAAGCRPATEAECESEHCETAAGCPGSTREPACQDATHPPACQEATQPPVCPAETEFCPAATAPPACEERARGPAAIEMGLPARGRSLAYRLI
jgi:hypothetical protein